MENRFDDNRKFSFENLEAYKEARALVKGIYLLQNKFPKEEKYALGDQIRRSSTSITSNIAEGSGRNSLKEKIHFVELTTSRTQYLNLFKDCRGAKEEDGSQIAFGSMTESFSQLQNAQDLGYITVEDIDALRPMYNKVAGLLSGLKRSYEKRLTTEPVNR